MKPTIFREYDIRGVVDKDITDEDVVVLGKAIGTYMDKAGVRRICLGRDCRLSSDRYRDLLVEGLVATGREVIDIGVCPTPLLYFSVFHFDVDGGVMITASHNPPEYNGFKVMVGKSTIWGPEIKKLYEIATSGQFASGTGAVEPREIIPPYIDYVSSNVRISGLYPWQWTLATALADLWQYRSCSAWGLRLPRCTARWTDASPIMSQIPL